MSLQLLRAQRELTEAVLRLAAGATVDDLFTFIAPSIADAYGLRRIELRAESGYSRTFGSNPSRLRGHDVLRFPLSIDSKVIGELELETQGAAPNATLGAVMRQVAALFALALSKGDDAGAHDTQNEEWRALFDEHPAPLVVYDVNSANIVAANAAFCESYGFDHDELVGQRFTEVCVPDAEYNELVDPDDHHMAVRCRHHRRDGTRLDVEVSTRYCMWMGENACMALINDVTTRTRIERRLVESEKRLERVQEIGGVGIFEVDLRTGRRYWSKEMRRQFGLTEGDALSSVLRMDFEKHVHPGDRVAVQIAYDRAVEKREPFRIDHRVIQPSGEVAWVQLQAELDFDEDGTPIRAIGTTVDITERKMAEEQLGFLAHYDPLTGLANRAHAISRLQNILRATRRGTAHPALLFIDLDHFKTVNDTLGHDVGDQLLVEVGRRIKDATRDSDCVARMGGDEFIIIIANANSPQGADHVARRVLGVLEQPVKICGRDILVTCSIGIAFCTENVDVEVLLSRADMAMYQAKRTGRNRYCVYQDEMLRDTVERMEIEIDLRRALDKNELFLTYQPIVDVKTSSVIGSEALVRWRHPDGVRMPATFIAIAEESNLIQIIGEWVLREACRQSVEWDVDGEFLISVNVSRRQLTDPHFVSIVLNIVDETGIDPHMLQLEITETALSSDVERTHQNLTALRALGIRIAIDDFGTGYNSLAILRYSVIDSLKIDRSFITDIASSASDMAIASAVISAGRGLGVRVVAEGVETEEHYNTLRRLGCDQAQGYWFSKPVEAQIFFERYVRPLRSASRKRAYSA